MLRADTRVTNHGFRAGRAGAYQSVLQAGTAVLVDDRGVPRVRCACGNPLRPPVAMRGTPRGRGSPWPGYRPGEVIVVTPAPQVITDFTIIDVASRTWIERPTGHDVRHDRALPPPVWAQRPPAPSEPPPTVRHESLVPREPLVPRESGVTSRESGVVPDPDTVTDVPPPDETGPFPDEPAPENPGGSDEVGPDTVPDSPDLPDGAGLIPDGD